MNHDQNYKHYIVEGRGSKAVELNCPDPTNWYSLIRGRRLTRWQAEKGVEALIRDYHFMSSDLRIIDVNKEKK
jgi:hypothetical protein